MAIDSNSRIEMTPWLLPPPIIHTKNMQISKIKYVSHLTSCDLFISDCVMMSWWDGADCQPVSHSPCISKAQSALYQLASDYQMVNMVLTNNKSLCHVTTASSKLSWYELLINVLIDNYLTQLLTLAVVFYF